MSSSSALKKFAVVKKAKSVSTKSNAIVKKSTEQRRLRDEKLPLQRLTKRKENRRLNSVTQRLKKQTALALLQLQDNDAFEEIVSKNTETNTERQRQLQLREENKRPTLAQAERILKRFERKFGIKSVLRRRTAAKKRMIKARNMVRSVLHLFTMSVRN